MMKRQTVKELKARIEALQELNDLLLRQAVESRKLLESLGVEKPESSMERWIV